MHLCLSRQGLHAVKSICIITHMMMHAGGQSELMTALHAPQQHMRPSSAAGAKPYGAQGRGTLTDSLWAAVDGGQLSIPQQKPPRCTSTSHWILHALHLRYAAHPFRCSAVMISEHCTCALHNRLLQSCCCAVLLYTWWPVHLCGSFVDCTGVNTDV